MVNGPSSAKIFAFVTEEEISRASDEGATPIPTLPVKLLVPATLMLPVKLGLASGAKYVFAQPKIELKFALT
jgi:hypothetical protein